MQTDTETRNPWIGWRFTTRDELEAALDQYASFQGETLVRRYGEMEGGDSDKAMVAHEYVMRQNVAIDAAMARLRHIHRLSYRLIDAFYRSGLCYEANGRERALERVAFVHDEDHCTPYAGLFYHCQSQRERDRQKQLFDTLQASAVDALYAVHWIVRPGHVG